MAARTFSGRVTNSGETAFLLPPTHLLSEGFRSVVAHRSTLCWPYSYNEHNIVFPESWQIRRNICENMRTDFSSCTFSTMSNVLLLVPYEWVCKLLLLLLLFVAIIGLDHSEYDLLAFFLHVCICYLFLFVCLFSLWAVLH